MPEPSIPGALAVNIELAITEVSSNGFSIVAAQVTAASASADIANAGWMQPVWLFAIAPVVALTLIAGVHSVGVGHRMTQKHREEVRQKASAILCKPYTATERNSGRRQLGRSPPSQERVQIVIAGSWEDDHGRCRHL